ncbi:Z-ring formation inhibitor MciZ [Halalkalibacterium ligniniphilum]|uniref:Z-ring formation inhibitor MciZ n=1 Tax=Halalkalibacterium ligniniphilum TaxID=1134413 RepID=UPI0009D9C4E7
MKVYVYRNGITIAGKAWEVRAKLREAKKNFETVNEWCQAVHPPSSKLTRTASATPRKKAGSSEYPLPIVRIGCFER